MSRYKRLLVLTFAFSLANSGTANAALPPRISANAYASTDYTIGEADLMLPMAGDRRHNFYADPTVAYGTDNQGTADLGLGYRWIKKDAAIFGVYLFGGYTRIDNNARLWVANPGLEALGSRWDAHLNAYLPMGDRHTTVSVFPKNFFFTGHSLFSDLNNLSQYAGAGGDISIGGQLFSESPLKAYVGSYFFNPAQTNHIWGGAAGLEYWLDNNIKVFASYTYDSLRHSTAAFGMGVELGGTHTTRINPTLEERMTDPVGRYLADLGRGSAIPSRLKARPIPNTFYLYQNNIAFFSQTGAPNNGGLGLSLANCTFENPCGPIDFTNQATTTLNSLLPSTLFAFEDGAFSATDVPGGVNPVTVRTGQSITSIGSTPATLVGGFILEGNNSVNRISLQPTASTATGPGITVLAGNNQITSTQIGSTATPFAIGLRTLDSSGTLISNSTIFASSVGIQNEDDGFTVLSASNLEVDAGTNPGIGINSIGNSFTSAQDNSVVTVRGGDNSVGIRSASSGPLPTLVDHSAVNVAGGANTAGIDYLGSSGINLQSGSINVTGATNSSGVLVEGSSSGAVNLANNAVTVNLGSATGGTGIRTLSGSDSTVTVNASPIRVTGGDNTSGINNLGNGAMSLANGSAVTVIGGNNSTGIVDSSSALMTIADSSVNVTGGTSTIGIDYFGSGGINVERSLITVTGGDNSTGVAVEGSSSGNVNLTNSSVIVDPTDVFVKGINILTGSASIVTVNASQIEVTGGDNTVGVSNLGNGTTSITDQSTITVIGASNSTGIVDGSSSLMTITGSSVDITGGTNTVGLDYLGSGGITLGGSRINVIGAANSSGVVVEGGSSGVVNLAGSPVVVNLGSVTGGTGINILNGSASTVTVGASAVTITGGDNTIGLNNSGNGSTSLNGSAVTVTGGNNSTGILDVSSTQMTINNSSINASGGASTVGFDYLGSGGISLQSSSINVAGATNSSGVLVEDLSSGAVNLNSSSVMVNAGSATGGRGINILLGSPSTVTVNGSQINVSGGGNTRGVNNLGNGSTSLSNGSMVTVTGGNNSSGIVNQSLAMMTIDNSSIGVTGGTSTIGLNNLGNGSTNLSNGSAVTVMGGNNSMGIVNQSPATMTMDNSSIGVTGGTFLIGLSNLGSIVNISSGSSITVVGVANSTGIKDISGDLMTVNNSAVNVTGGTNTFGIDYTGSGGMNLTETVVNVTGGDSSIGFKYADGLGTGAVNMTNSTLAVDGGTSSGAIGLYLFPNDMSEVVLNASRIQVSGGSTTSGVTLDGAAIAHIENGSSISVDGKTGFTYGMRSLGTSSIITNSSSMVVLQSGSEANGVVIGMEAQSVHPVGAFSIDSDNFNLFVGANNTQAIGVLLNNDAAVEFFNSTIVVSGNSNSQIAFGPGLIATSMTSCTLNGEFVSC